MLLEPPLPHHLPDWLTATIVLPKAKESGSNWVLCWWALPPSVYGSSLIGVGMMLAAETVEATSRPSAATAAAVHTDLALRPLSPTMTPMLISSPRFVLVRNRR